jgi:hypothetical protein
MPRPQTKRNQVSPRFATRSQRLEAKRARRKARALVRPNVAIQDKIIEYGKKLAQGRENFETLVQRGEEVTYRDNIEEA